MEFSADWDAVFNPQKGSHYFDRAQEIPFTPEGSEFRPGMAWWLAELSRWVYNVDGTRGNPRSVARAHLSDAGLREVHFLSRDGTHAAIVESQRTLHRDPFAVLAFRGSSEPRNWITNLMAFETATNAHFGYERALDRIWQEVESVLANCSLPLFLTGHSMGGALAGLAALRLSPAGLYTFGAPRILARTHANVRSPAPSWRVVNYRDLAPGRSTRGRFRHVGELIYISHDCALWHKPSAASIAHDRSRGARHLTERRRLSIPEPVSDHAPINYVAHMERFALAESV